MLSYSKDEVKEALTIENIFDLLQEWGGEPEYTSFGIISITICHNPPGESNSRKLYYYENSRLFKCYTGCEGDGLFDIFELVIKVFKIQSNRDMDFNEAIRYLSFKFGIISEKEDEEVRTLLDWKFLNNYDRIEGIQLKDYSINLKEYDKSILNRFNYKVKLTPWLNENISQEAIQQAQIGFFPGSDQITIPHFDLNGRFIGLRGRTLCQEEAERFGKYRPMFVNGLLYNHPLGMNLYNLNYSKKNIKLFGKAIVLEAEKATLQYKSYFGPENDISVACCGSSFSAHQMQLLLDLGVKEVVFAFDRQFQQIGDKEFQHLTANLTKLYKKYKNYTNISFIFDKKMITKYKASPTDEGRDKFLQLFKERVFLK